MKLAEDISIVLWNNSTTGVFKDLKKKFETIDHSLLSPDVEALKEEHCHD